MQFQCVGITDFGINIIHLRSFGSVCSAGFLLSMTQGLFWEIVGGADKGGILVRAGKELKSEEKSGRLSHGALVREIEFFETNGRLHYEIVKGTGPENGWVSIQISGKELARRTAAPFEDDEAAPEDMPEAEWRIHRRCKRERQRDVPEWKPISIEQVMNNHTRVAPGMFYGLHFPWSEEMLLSSKFGAEWLTQAMHVAGTLPMDNKVMKVSADPFKITTGNNGGKFLFEVEYLHSSPDLHTRLFAKIPHAMEQATQSDRLSSSVNKQPMEFYELNSSRLLEATLPVKIPRYYFADISNETSNWILITESIDFKDPKRLDFEGKTRGAPKEQLEALEIEGPYDKCMDWCLRGEPKDYYMTLVRCGARMAGLAHKGCFGDSEVLGKYFENFAALPFSSFGMKAECSGQPPNQLKTKIDTALSFMADTGKVLFPSFCRTEDFQQKLRNTLMKLNAYAAEMNYWCHADKDYIAFTHNNLNVDNAYFWRNASGELELGVFDWGSMGSRSLGFKMWWWLYCHEFEDLSANLDAYLECCDFGGPKLQKEVLRMQFILTGLQQMFGLVSAVGQIYKMCPKKEWATIKDRYDPRVGDNIHGKSTLRLYLQVMRTICLIVEEWKADKVVDDFEEKVTELLGGSKKAPSTMQA
ncbi:Uncharacterized protein SCF082_LOCUS50671 [Durusdinium trenchii]|uniref:Aminoglycoside phosphotransferase domain-containing protein n=1 Tax=Durusdinium trenchii TaxID=1381693 RepID=A0ABP0S9I3_9DINO